MLHLREFIGTCDAKSQVGEVVAAVGMQHDSMMLVVHPQVASFGLAFIEQLESNDVSREIFPCVEILHPEPHVAQLCYLDHLYFLRAFHRASVRTQSEPRATRRTESVSVG